MVMEKKNKPRRDALKGLTEAKTGESPIKDAVVPGDKWEFDGAVADSFDNMLERSIPQYRVMRDLTFTLGRSFIQRKTDVVDLGCARGAALADFVNALGAHNRFVGVEVSEPMLAAARSRYEGLIDAGVVEIRDDDLRLGYPPVRASLTLAVLTILFTPIEHRLRIFRNIFEHTVPGGAVILVEKVLGGSSPINELMVERYYEMKRDHGYSQDDIDRKRLSLEGVQVPVTAKMNEEFIRLSGFNEIDCFWRWCNFMGWIAIKH